MRHPSFENERQVARRPHAVAPALASTRLLMVSYKQKRTTSFGGMGVAASNTARVLRRAGVQVDAWEVENLIDLANRLERDEYRTERLITHVCLHGPNWEPDRLQELANRWPDADFIQLNHSGLSYLDLDHNGACIERIRRFLDMQLAMQNVKVAANNSRVTGMFRDALGHATLYLPNLYYWETLPYPVVRRDHDPLRIGSFGVGRDWKNQPVAAHAALSIARRLSVNLELHVNIDPWNTYTRVRRGRQNLFFGLPNAKLIEHEWQDWPSFRRLVSAMDLLISPSYDETFCCVCADGIVEGIPTVGTDAMEWLPSSWRCREPFDQASVVATGMTMLHDRIGTINEGRRALDGYVSDGTRRWIEYLIK